MNESLQLFNHERFGVLRVVEHEGEPWFVAADACRGLDHSNVSMALARLDEDEKAKLDLGLQGGCTNAISFPGLLSLILGSRKKEAREYKRWVTHEVLPSVHCHGGYVGGQDSVGDSELMARALQVSRRIIDSKQALIDKMEPKAAFADAVSDSDDLVLVRELAHVLKQNGFEVGQNRLFTLLRKEGFIEKNRNEPTQKSLELGIMRVVETTHTDFQGRTFVNRTPKVTGKGQAYFVHRYCGCGEVA